MVSYNVPKKDFDSHLIFPTIKKCKIKVGEIIELRLIEGKTIIGIVDEICSDNEHFWLKSTSGNSPFRERFSMKLDQVIKLD